MKLLRGILDYGELTLSDIGIVSPYKGQVRTLRTCIFKAFPEAEKNKELEIASVDNFQGREKELIIFSAVRCNNKGNVGFLKDWRRLNVMITRARRGLVVVGSAATLVCDRHWRMWLSFTEDQGGCSTGTVGKACAVAKETLEQCGKVRMARMLFAEVEPPAKSQVAVEDQPPPKKRKKAKQQVDWENWEEDEWAETSKTAAETNGTSQKRAADVPAQMHLLRRIERKKQMSQSRMPRHGTIGGTAKRPGPRKWRRTKRNQRKRTKRQR